jgi:hypothetical protein
LPGQYGIELMIEAIKILFGNSFFKSAELYPRGSYEDNYQAEEEKNSLIQRKIGVFGNRIGSVYQEYNDEVYEITKHF